MATTCSIYVDVKVFVGYDIRQVAQDICDLSNRMGVTVCADVNDSFLMAHPGSTPQAVLENYSRALGIKDGR